jgi:hypothetical protein
MNNQNLGQRLTNLVRGAFANRRGARRLAISLPMRFAVVCQQKGVVIGKTRSVPARSVNMSRNGLSFESNTIQIEGMHISLNADASIYKTLELEIALPERGIQLKGVPQWHERSKDTGKYLVGVKITAMPPEDRKVYESFLRERASTT